MIHVSPKKIAFTIAPLLVLGALLYFGWGLAAQATATASLYRTSDKELSSLTPAVTALMQGVAPTSGRQCAEVSHTYTTVHLYCDEWRDYAHTLTPLPAVSRAKVVAEARALDQALAQNGWTADRPQDAAHTVESAIPTAPLAQFIVNEVPFHKNVNGASCNLVVEFGGPTDGTSPGVININDFSCQQNVSYPQLNFTNYVDQGFGG